MFEKQTELANGKERRKKLDSLIESAFEEKLEGKISADLCVKYREENKIIRKENNVTDNKKGFGGVAKKIIAEKAYK